MSEFAGVRLSHDEEWLDITDDLPKGTPFTLAMGEEGAGVLQFSVGRYESGPRPDFDVRKLKKLLLEFADEKGLGPPGKLQERAIPPLVSGDFESGDSYIRAWYLSDGESIALVTYTGGRLSDPTVERELRSAEEIVRSITFP